MVSVSQKKKQRNLVQATVYRRSSLDSEWRPKATTLCDYSANKDELEQRTAAH